MFLLFFYTKLFVNCHAHRKKETYTGADDLKRGEFEFEEENVEDEGNADAKIAQNTYCCWISALVVKSIQQLCTVVEDGDRSQ